MFVLSIIDSIFFALLTFCVLYKLFFILAAFLKRPLTFEPSEKHAQIAVLFPVYAEGTVILQSIKSFQNQSYPSENYQTIVVADHCDASHVEELRSKYPVRVFDVNFENSSKAKALNYAMEQLVNDDFDVVVILDVDNHVDVDFLEKINLAYQNGCKAIQTQRVASSISTPVAMLDAITEAINNTIFRNGHSKVGLSAALIGSGMAFDATLFRENVGQLSTIGEDKELELLLSAQKVHVHYLHDALVYDQKVSGSAAFNNQRRRWMSAQCQMLFKALQISPKVYRKVGIDFFDKIIQWFMLPNSLLVAFVAMFSIITSLFLWSRTFKWWVLFFVLVLILFVAIPRKFYTKKLIKSLAYMPWLVVLMFVNLLRLYKTENKFRHTKHD